MKIIQFIVLIIYTSAFDLAIASANSPMPISEFEFVNSQIKTNYDYEMIYLDTRNVSTDIHLKEIEESSKIVKDFSVSLGLKGLVFLAEQPLTKQAEQNQRRILDSIQKFRENKFSYSDAPFLAVYLWNQPIHSPDKFISFAGMPIGCIEQFFDDAEQAVHTGKFHSYVNEADWKIDASVCKVSQEVQNAYQINLESILDFLKAILSK